MKPPLIFITLIVFAFQCARAADKPNFFAARGEYRLSATTTLIISEEEQTPHYTLKSAVQRANTATAVSHGATLDGTKTGEPFIFYWDADSQVLWWATQRRLGYCDTATLNRPRARLPHESHRSAQTFHHGPKHFSPK